MPVVAAVAVMLHITLRAALVEVDKAGPARAAVQAAMVLLIQVVAVVAQAALAAAQVAQAVQEL